MAAERGLKPGSGVVPPRLSMVVLGARDLPVLRRFYVGLGWPERPGASDALAMFELGPTVLALHPASAEDAAIEREQSQQPSTTLVIHVETREAVDAAVAAAVAAGARRVSAPADQPWGGRSALVADPEGNRWEVLWVPRAGAGDSDGPGTGPQ